MRPCVSIGGVSVSGEGSMEPLPIPGPGYPRGEVVSRMCANVDDDTDDDTDEDTVDGTDDDTDDDISSLRKVHAGMGYVLGFSKKAWHDNVFSGFEFRLRIYLF